MATLDEAFQTTEDFIGPGIDIHARAGLLLVALQNAMLRGHQSPAQLVEMIESQFRVVQEQAVSWTPLPSPPRPIVPIHETRLTRLPFRKRALDAFERLGLITVADLLECSTTMLLQTIGLGRKTIMHIEGVLAAHGVALKGVAP